MLKNPALAELLGITGQAGFSASCWQTRVDLSEQFTSGCPSVETLEWQNNLGGR
jgi:hypothetical protein